MPERVLAPIHDGDLCTQIVDRAAELTDDGGQLFLAHILDPAFLGQLPGASRAPDSTMESMRNLGRRLLDREAKRVRDRGFEVETIIRRGALLEVIEDLIHEYEVETLVVGGHKHQFIEASEEHDWSEVVEGTGVEVEIVPVEDD